MKLFCTCSEDTYITNKIIGDNKSHNANVGSAGTLDLFKLWGETLYRSSGNQDEVSRILLKFDFGKIKNKISDDININSPKFNARLKLFDITAGNVTPSNFTVMVTPLSQSFLEGSGKDVGSFSNIGMSNFLTASYLGGEDVKWFVSGANAQGKLGAKNIDHIVTADLDDGSGEVNIIASQYFKTGTENLDIDITNVVSASLAGTIKDHGFRISFSGSDDSDKKSRFVKRFASRHASNPHKRPRIEISYDDSVQDNHLNFIFNHSGSLYLENMVNSSRSNILSGSALTPVVVPNCMDLKLEAAKFSYSTKVSQVTKGSDSIGVKGFYSASFAIDTFNSSNFNSSITVADKIARDGFIDFRTYWTSLDGNHVFHTGSLKIKRSNSFSGTNQQQLRIRATNLRSEYKSKENKKIRLFAIDDSIQHRSSKFKSQLKSVIIPQCHYRLVDVDTGQMVFDFDEKSDSTKVSSDSFGMFFNFDFSVATKGRSYIFEYLVIHGSDRVILRDSSSRFLVN